MLPGFSFILGLISSINIFSIAIKCCSLPLFVVSLGRFVMVGRARSLNLLSKNFEVETFFFLNVVLKVVLIHVGQEGGLAQDTASRKILYQNFL